MLIIFACFLLYISYNKSNLPFLHLSNNFFGLSYSSLMPILNEISDLIFCFGKELIFAQIRFNK